MFESIKFKREFVCFHSLSQKHGDVSEIYIDTYKIIAIEPAKHGARIYLDQYVWEVEEGIGQIQSIMFGEE